MYFGQPLEQGQLLSIFEKSKTNKGRKLSTRQIPIIRIFNAESISNGIVADQTTGNALFVFGSFYSGK